jgi:glycosyltransferase involved in cell wall biosynthesis
MKIAIVYDKITKFGGAERILKSIFSIWPNATLYTSVYEEKVGKSISVNNLKKSFLNKFPLAKSFFEFYFFLSPYIYENFDFTGFDLVISLTSQDSKSLLIKPGTLHICYCLTPVRFLWSGAIEYITQPGFLFVNYFLRYFMKLFFPLLRKWDYISAQRPDIYLSISKNVSKRIQVYYKRKSQLLYPSVDTNKFKPAKSQKRNYYLIVSRLVPYKMIDYAIEAFNQLDQKLIIIGSGIDLNRLKSIAYHNIKFIHSELTDEKICWYYQNCTALVFPGEEDFGLVMVEAQACGKPVIAYYKGGASEIIINNKTGILYQKNNASCLKETLCNFEAEKFSSIECRNNALRFSDSNFKKKLKKIIEDYRIN